MQDDVIKAGGILILVTALQNSTDKDMMILAMKTLENLSYGMCLKPNLHAQITLQEVQGVQVMLKIFQHHSNKQVQTQAFCTLALTKNQKLYLCQLF